MKSFYFIMSVVFVLTTRTAYAQSVPRYITNAFNSKYPTAKNILWKHQLNDFNATFQAEDNKYVASFNSNGEWKKTQKEITLSVLPEVIKSNLMKSNYVDWNISKAYILYFPYVKPKYHVIVAKGETAKKNLLYTESGKLRKNNFTM